MLFIKQHIKALDSIRGKWSALKEANSDYLEKELQLRAAFNDMAWGVRSNKKSPMEEVAKLEAQLHAQQSSLDSAQADVDTELAKLVRQVWKVEIGQSYSFKEANMPICEFCVHTVRPTLVFGELSVLVTGVDKENKQQMYKLTGETSVRPTVKESLLDKVRKRWQLGDDAQI